MSEGSVLCLVVTLVKRAHYILFECYLSNKRTLYLYLIATVLISTTSVLCLVVALVLSVHYILCFSVGSVIRANYTCTSLRD